MSMITINPSTPLARIQSIFSAGGWRKTAIISRVKQLNLSPNAVERKWAY